jgi:PPP family 3-phenylpropionic acid transporter
VKTSSDTETRSGFYQIAALTFMTYAARGFILPYINLYLISVGFSGTQIGLLASVSALVQLVVTPLLHTFADHAGRHRQLYYGLLLGNACACFGLLGFANFPLLLSGSILLRDSTDTPSAALLSQLTLTWLKQRQRNVYGRLRAFGSLGWAVTTMISGWFYGLGGYALLFALSAALNLVLIPQVKVLPQRTTEPHEKPNGKASRPRGFYILLASVFLYFVGNTAFSAFSNVYFKQGLGASNEMIGVLSSVAGLSELPAMILIDRLLRRADIRATLILGMLGLGGIWFTASLLAGPTLLIPLMMVRGTFFTLQNVSLTLLVSRISHSVNAATNQALTQVTVPALAVLLTGSISGWLFDHAGGRVLLQAATAMAVVSSILLMIAWKQLASRENNLPDSL